MRLASTGKVLPKTAISDDGKSWIKAESISALSFSDATTLDDALADERKSWFVKTKHGDAGPFTEAKLKKLVSDGRIKPNVLISENQIKWIKAYQQESLGLPAPIKPRLLDPALACPPPRNHAGIIAGEYRKRFGTCVQVVCGKKLSRNRRDVDVHVYPASDVRPITTVVTSGLSDHSLATGEGPISSRRELILYVDAFHDAHAKLLQCVARDIVKKQQPWGYGDVIANCSPARPIFKHSRLDHFLMMVPNIASDFAIRSTVEIEGDPLHMIWVFPVTEIERVYVDNLGVQAFCNLLDQEQSSITLNPKRECYAKDILVPA